jgi:hypothetical protein
MHRFSSAIRRPVKREGAEQYLLITLLSFAASVTLTRLFLEFTGYPQLGSGTLHIAHVLWGGLLLFAASLLPLLVANRWAYTLSALISGAGVGLFIDEVGKFITQNNDYFHPLAAPIVYAFFLLTVLLYLRVRRPPTRDARAELYRALDAMEEVLEHDLDAQERLDLEQRLSYVAKNAKEPDLAHLAEELQAYLASDTLNIAPERSTLLDQIEKKMQTFDQNWLTRPRFRAALAGGLLALGLVALANMFQSLPVGPMMGSLERALERLVAEGQLNGSSGLSFFLARLALETSVGLLLMIAAGLLIAGKDRMGISFGYLGLLLSLTTVNLLVFYFDQFSAIVTASVQFAIFLGLVYYRRKYLSEPRTSASPQDYQEGHLH